MMTLQGTIKIELIRKFRLNDDYKSHFGWRPEIAARAFGKVEELFGEMEFGYIII